MKSIHLKAGTSLPLPIDTVFWRVSRVVLACSLIMAGVSNICSQSALDGFDPNANGNVWSITLQPDAKIIVGGDFAGASSIGGQDRNFIARLDGVTGLADPFDPNADGVVVATALQSDGKILAAGVFSNIGGAPRKRLARLNAITGLADSFNPDANGNVLAVALQADGKILAGGAFSNIGGQMRNRLARLEPGVGLADSFNASANGAVLAIAVQGDGKILVAGMFFGTNSISGQTRNRIARLDAATGLADSFDPNANGVVRAVVVQPDGKVLIGGDFTTLSPNGGPAVARNRIARLNPDGTVDAEFNPNANGIVRSIVVQADGKILASGLFAGPNSIGGQRRNGIARLNPITGLADGFDPDATTSDVFAMAQQSDGKILAGGLFTTLSPNGGPAVPRSRIARLEKDGRLDRALDLQAIGNYVYATAIQADGKFLIAGLFTNVLGITRSNIARLNTDGTLDTDFDPNATGFIRSIAVQPDGKIIAGGAFSIIGGQLRRHLARLDATTGLADSFDPNPDHFIESIALQTDGKILVVGVFTNIAGQERNHIARLDGSTGLADSFNPNANNRILSLAVQSDGRIVVGGTFGTIGGQTRNHIARLDSATGLADSFNPNADSYVYSLAVQSDGKIVVGGAFENIGGQVRNHIARLDGASGLADSFNPNANASVSSIALQADGKILAGGYFTSIGNEPRNFFARLVGTTGLADPFDPNPNAESLVTAIAIQEDGKILIGGDFTTVGGQTRRLFARLRNDTAALQNLEVRPTSVTWARFGSSPQVARVMFESSTNYVNFTSLGSAVAHGADWTLADLELSTGQSISIRARGYVRGGVVNGSESIMEFVRNLYLPPRVALWLPVLSIHRATGTNVVLSWATNASGFKLEASMDLNTSAWSEVSPGVAVIGTNHVLTNEASGSVRFYRLRL